MGRDVERRVSVIVRHAFDPSDHPFDRDESWNLYLSRSSRGLAVVLETLLNGRGVSNVNVPSDIPSY
jgi:hypothetical protein